MEVKVHYEEPKRLKNIAIFVSKESHCLIKLLDAKAAGKISANIVVIVGSEKTTNSIAEKYQIPFYNIVHSQQTDAEIEILEIMDRFNVDLIVLGRYMRILTLILFGDILIGLLIFIRHCCLLFLVHMHTFRRMKEGQKSLAAQPILLQKTLTRDLLFVRNHLELDKETP